MHCSFRGHKVIYLMMAGVRICTPLLHLPKINNTLNILETIPTWEQKLVFQLNRNTSYYSWLALKHRLRSHGHNWDQVASESVHLISEFPSLFVYSWAMFSHSLQQCAPLLGWGHISCRFRGLLGSVWQPLHPGSCLWL